MITDSVCLLSILIYRIENSWLTSFRLAVRGWVGIQQYNNNNSVTKPVGDHYTKYRSGL